MKRASSLLVILLYELSYLKTSEANNLWYKTNDTEGTQFLIRERHVGSIGVTYQGNVSVLRQSSWTFQYRYTDQNFEEPFIHTAVISPNPNVSVVFELRHFHSETWTLPVILADCIINYANKTLCIPAEEGRDNPYQSLEIIVSTQNVENVEFTILLSTRYVGLDTPLEKKNISVSPTLPVYYKLSSFLDNITSEYIRLDVSLVENIGSPACFTVSVQKHSCPVQTYEGIEGNLQLKAISHTMSTTTTLNLLREVFDENYYLVFIMHNNYSLCGSDNSLLEQNISKIGKKVKHLEFRFSSSISPSDYLFATVGLLPCYLVISIVITVVYIKCSNAVTPLSHEILSEDDEPLEYHRCFFFFNVKGPSARINVSLQKHCSKSQIQISKSAQRYCGTFWVASLFYVIPVVQFVALYQHVFLRTGNEDQCYFNFKCLHPYKSLTAFNHVFSNVGYVILGFLFLLLVRFDHHRYIKRGGDGGQGLFAQYGLYYAMGSGLVIEGVMSALYHVCPTRLNFQFDTSFMYVIATLCLVKIYRSRHLNSNANSILTFLAIPFTMILVVVTTYYPEWWLWAMVSVVHIVASLIVSVHLYSWGDWKFCGYSDGKNILTKGTCQDNIKSFLTSFHFPFLRPIEPMTIALLVLNIFNWMLTVVVYVKIYKTRDIAFYVLSVFLLNLGGYIGLYAVFKLWVAKERILWPTWLYLVLAIPFWISGLILFSQETATWNFPQAKSREINEDCVFLMFYDYHDIWHFLSAFGMFFAFMFLFTVDDGLKFTDRSMIKVF